MSVLNSILQFFLPVTRAGSKAKSEQSEVSEQIQLSQAEDSSEGKEQFKLFSIPLLSLSREEFIKEQAADPMLNSLFELVCPESELKCARSGYFLNGWIAVREVGSVW